MTYVPKLTITKADKKKTVRTIRSNCVQSTDYIFVITFRFVEAIKRGV